MFRNLGAFASVLLCLIPISRVHAESDPSQTFRDFGLEGVWSPDCGNAPSQDNPRVYYWVRSSGAFTHAVTFDGRTFALVDTISAASRVKNDHLRFSVMRNGLLALTATVERQGTKIHTVTSVGADGTIYYSNGVEVLTGKPSLLDERCDGASPIS
jgi:hypothetical protein